MALSLENLLTVTPAELVANRHVNVNRFLTERDLDPAWLADLMRERVGPGCLLLTSSPVHGLANPGSDFDFIRIQDEPIEGPRISTKIFERGHHLEIVSFSAAELTDNLAELARLADSPPAEVVVGFRSWDRRREPRRKQTERIVNGITLDGSMPYLQSLPALGLVWSRAALHSAVEQVVHLCLAEAAGELRGRVGYALNTLLHLMDAVLSHHGDVYTTRKWYLLRWTRFVRSGQCHDVANKTVAQELERLRSQVAHALSDASQRLADDYVALVRQAARATGAAADVTVRCELAEDVQRHAFLPGASALVAPHGSLVVPDDVPAGFGPLSLAELAGIGADQAQTVLRTLRAGLAQVRIDYQQQGDVA